MTARNTVGWLPTGRAQKKPRRPGRGKSGYGESSYEDISRVSQPSTNDGRAANLRLVLSTGRVKGEAPAVADGSTVRCNNFVGKLVFPRVQKGPNLVTPC